MTRGDTTRSCWMLLGVRSMGPRIRSVICTMPSHLLTDNCVAATTCGMSRAPFDMQHIEAETEWLRTTGTKAGLVG